MLQVLAALFIVSVVCVLLTWYFLMVLSALSLDADV